MAMRKGMKVLAWIGGLIVAGLAAASVWFWFAPVGLNNYVNKLTLQLTFDSPQILTQLGFIDNTPFDFHSGKLDDETKAHEDAVGWAAETDATMLEAESARPTDPRRLQEILASIGCPTLAIHGDDDKVVSHEVGVEAARITGGTLVTFGGSGHIPNLRDPVRFNLLIREFAERVPA